ncbi:flavin reductase family protein [Nocardiopsis mangrovi]|uniref:Flavin reductase family protein n=1 Tax=Nocardiopsis mangrovi TaxID=1179818 RepID=A0ABV9E7J3_9ACTN
MRTPATATDGAADPSGGATDPREGAAGAPEDATERLPRDTGVGADRFRRALGGHAAGVVVVTAAGPAGPVGVTATSFTSVSLDPPLVSFYIDSGSGSWPGIRDSASFAVNVLAEDQRDVAARFAARGADRFAAPTRWRRGAEGLPLIEGAAVHILCLRHDLMAVGDHWLVVGRVAAAEVGGELGGDAARPLLYHRGTYGRFS